jgi:hypothetical protein
MPPIKPTRSRARVRLRLLRGLLWIAATCLLLAALGALVVLGIVLSADSSPRWMPDPIAAWGPGAVMFAAAFAFRACARALFPHSDAASVDASAPILAALWVLGCLAAAVAVVVVAIRLL